MYGVVYLRVRSKLRHSLHGMRCCASASIFSVYVQIFTVFVFTEESALKYRIMVGVLFRCQVKCCESLHSQSKKEKLLIYMIELAFFMSLSYVKIPSLMWH